ncbi:MAG: dicarboxylate/amino acid:cation symporter [Candidatus Hydrogenedentes bacterium]|nr:dicarboxylate/amino acid:cation symporter [Candidatus Hydrogenedentota bacterium]
MRKISLHTRILLAMALGLAIGLAMHTLGDQEAAAFQTAIWWLDLIGKDIFIGALKMIIAPLILASIVAGIYSLPNARELGNVGIKTLIYYFCTTTIAVFIGVVAVLVIRPGEKDASRKVREDRIAQLAEYQTAFETQSGISIDTDQGRAEFVTYIGAREGEDLGGSSFQSNWDRIQSTKDRAPLDMMREEILRPILTNPFTALAKNPPNALGIIFFAMLLGLALVIIGEPAKPVGAFFESFNKVMLTITMWIMELAPYGIACIIASLVATLGVEALQSLAWYCITVIGGIAVHVGVLLGIVALIGRMSPITFLKGIRDAWLIAFTTTSSAATLPITILCVTQKLKVSEKVSRFTLPVGATVNMDGTALYEGVAVIFLIQVYGGLADVPIELTFGKTMVIFITAVFASVGAAAIPSAGLITMAIVASAVGLPLHYIFFIYAVDRLLDMFRTSTNVMGDAVGAVVVNRLEAKNL